MVGEHALRGRWDPAIAALAKKTGAWPDRTVADFLQDRLEEDENQILIFDKDIGLTARQIHDRSQTLANWLVHRGYGPGDVISFQLPSWWEAVIIGMAGAMAGVILHPLLPVYREAELDFMLQDVGSKLLFIPEEFRGNDYPAMVRRLACPIDVVVLRPAEPNSSSFESIFETPAPHATLPKVNANSIRIAMYTSGTTGRPKCVLHTHNTIHADNHRLLDYCDLNQGDSVFFPGPVSHIGGIISAVNLPFYLGIPASLLDIWEPAAAFDLLKLRGCTYASGPTPFLRGLVNEAKRRGETLPKFRLWMCGGASVPPSLIVEAMEVFPSAMCWRTFGATEAPMITAPPAAGQSRRFASETDGRIYRADIKLVVPGTDIECPDDEEGEILARTESMCVGYLDSQDNARAFTPDGFLRTGDLGKIVEGEWLVITGRFKDLIIRNGENISAKEIEDALITHPNIREVAVIGVPSERTGEAVCVFLVTTAETDVSLFEVASWLAASGIAKYKTPELLYLVSELPVNSMGKVLKRNLRDTARDLVRSSEIAV